MCNDPMRNKVRFTRKRGPWSNLSFTLDAHGKNYKTIKLMNSTIKVREKIIKIKIMREKVINLQKTSWDLCELVILLIILVIRNRKFRCYKYVWGNENILKNNNEIVKKINVIGIE